MDKYLKIQLQASKIDISNDVNWKKYNQLAKKLFEIRNEIKKNSDCVEIFKYIIENSQGKNFADLHCNIAWSVQQINPNFSKEIYLKNKHAPIAKHILKKDFGIII